MKPATVREGVKWLPEKSMLDVFFITLNNRQDYSPQLCNKRLFDQREFIPLQSQSTTQKILYRQALYQSQE